MTKDELEKCLIHNIPVEYEGKSYRLRSVYTMNINEIPRKYSMVCEVRNLFLVDRAELYDKGSNSVFSVFASELKIDPVTAALIG